MNIYCSSTKLESKHRPVTLYVSRIGASRTRRAWPGKRRQQQHPSRSTQAPRATQVLLGLRRVSPRSFDWGRWPGVVRSFIGAPEFAPMRLSRPLANLKLRRCPIEPAGRTSQSAGESYARLVERTRGAGDTCGYPSCVRRIAMTDDPPMPI